MDETILYRCVGSPKVRRDQLARLAEMSCRKNIVVQIVPAAVGAHDGLAGAFVIAGLEDGESTLYLDAIEGQIIDRRGVIEMAVRDSTLCGRRRCRREPHGT